MTQSATVVFDAEGTPHQLSERLAVGGEGSIFPLSGRPEVLVKWYHSKIIEKRGDRLQRKIEAMRGMAELRDQPGLSWPRISVYDQNCCWLGYAMKRAEGKMMHCLAHAVLYKKHFPGLDRRQLVDYLIDLVNLLQKLHALKVRVGDYNLNNILCLPGRNQVRLIDCDSYQVEANGKLYRCEVGSADLTPKEQQGINFNELKRTDQSEAFSLAIVLFKCLMLGRHPYDIVGGDDPVTNLKNGNFAYGEGNRGIPTGAWYNIWSHMPFRMKTLFISTFTDGAEDPGCRATLPQWLEALKLYKKEMAKGWHEVAVVPDWPKSQSYRGNTILT